MRVVVVGATGTIGSAVARVLDARHEVVRVSHSRTVLKVDLAVPASIQRMYADIGRVDAVVAAAGQAPFRPLLSLTDADYAAGLSNKLMGQINLVRYGLDAMSDGGSFTLTGGLLSRHPMPGGAIISVVNAGLEAFVKSAALELPRRMRINLVAPGWVAETLAAIGRDPKTGVPVATIAEVYRELIEGTMTGQVRDTVVGAY